MHVGCCLYQYYSLIIIFQLEYNYRECREEYNIAGYLCCENHVLNAKLQVSLHHKEKCIMYDEHTNGTKNMHFSNTQGNESECCRLIFSCTGNCLILNHCTVLGIMIVTPYKERPMSFPKPAC